MKKRVEQLIKGTFEYAVPRINVSDPAISLTIPEGESYRGEFYFATEDNSTMKGMLISKDRRILLSEDKFSGSTIRVVFGIETEGLKADFEEKSSIVILSNLGEVVIPVQYKICRKAVKTSRGHLGSLDDFAVLAKEDYREAFRIFTSDDFLAFSPDEKKAYAALYKGMSQNPVTYQHMEEFLIGAGKKEPVYLTLDKEKKEVLRLEGSLKDTLYIYRSSWGYLRAEIEVTGDFLEVDKKIITSEDFIGSVYGLEYIIRWDRLGSGKRYGTIRIRTVYGELLFEICASAAGDIRISMHGFESRTKRDLTRIFLDYCLDRIDALGFQEKTFGILEELKNSGNFGVLHQLYEAWIYLKHGNELKAMQLVQMIGERKFTAEESQEEGAYLYLAQKTGVRNCSTGEYVERLRTLYRRNPRSVVLLYIILQEDESIRTSPVKQMHLMEQQFELGVFSPILYHEAYRLIEHDETQFRKLSPFMIQVLTFASKYQILTPKLGMRIAYLARHEKMFQESVYRILCATYEVYPEKDTVEAICRLVMLGQPRKKEYFRWYALAVEQDIRITRLYEFYVETMSRNYQGTLPKAVKLYFSYNNTLSSERKAFIYARVVKNREQDEDTYHLYEKAMEAFAVESLQKGKINEDYAVLYQTFVTEIRDAVIGSAYAKVMFAHRLYSDDPKVRNVIVCHNGLKKEESYPCRDGVAYINLYTDDAMILFEDAKRRRYVATVDYNLQKLVDEKLTARQCMALNLPDAGLLLYACGKDPEVTTVTVRNMGCFQLVADSMEFEESYCHKVRRKLLDYYDKNAGDDTLQDYLGRLDYDEFYKVDYLLLQDILIRHGFCKEAFGLIQKYGYEEIDITSLFHLCRRVILDMEFAEQEDLLYLTYYVVQKGKYDEVLLGYLRDTYMGSALDMLYIWEKLKGFSMDTYVIEEEILLIAMYTRIQHPKLSKVLESYTSSHGKELVIQAMLTYLAYGYFLGDNRIDMYVFKSLENLYEKEMNLDMVCKLALLKRYRFSKKLFQYQKQNVAALLRECRDHNLRFSFFKELPAEMIRGYQLEDKVFVEKTFAPNAKVVLHYAITTEGEVPVYKSEPLKNGFHGVFVREFLLFFGERLNYYLTVTEGEQTITTEEETVMTEVPEMSGMTKFEMINQMLANQKMGNHEACLKVLKRYEKMEHLTQRLFSVVE